MNELKLTQVELFFHFMCVEANASKLFCMAHLVNIERFLVILIFVLITKFYVHGNSPA